MLVEILGSVMRNVERMPTVNCNWIKESFFFASKLIFPISQSADTHIVALGFYEK
jgi:hypothetical protein